MINSKIQLKKTKKKISNPYLSLISSILTLTLLGSIISTSISCSKSTSSSNGSTKTFFDSSNGISLTYNIVYWQDLPNANSIQGTLLYLFRDSISNPTEIFTVLSPSSQEIPTGYGTSEKFGNTIFTTVTTDTPYNTKTYYTSHKQLTYSFTYTNKSKADFTQGDSTIENISLF